MLTQMNKSNKRKMFFIDDTVQDVVLCYDIKCAEGNKLTYMCTPNQIILLTHAEDDRATTLINKLMNEMHKHNRPDYYNKLSKGIEVDTIDVNPRAIQINFLCMGGSR